MKIMVVGVGGVGGYLASVLCANYPEVTVIARKERKAVLIKNGLVLHSDFFGEHVFHPAVTDAPATAGVQDIIFVCVKNYSLTEALTSIIPCVTDHTIVVLVMNGTGHAQLAKHIISKGQLVDTAIYITSASNPDYSTKQMGLFARIFIGPEKEPAPQKVYAALNHPGLKARLVPDINVEVWNKYITNCAYNVITAYYRGTIAQVFEQPQGKEEFHTLLAESYAVAKAKGINLAPDLVESIYTRVLNQKDKNTSSSLARDIIAGRPSELETFSGDLIRLAHTVAIPVPCTEKMYKAIKAAL